MIDLKRNATSLLLVLLLGALTVLLVTGRLRYVGTAPGSAAEADEPAAEEESRSHIVDGKVVLNEEDYRLSGVKTAEVAKGAVGVTLTANGEVQLAEDHWVRVTPQIPGVVYEVKTKSGAEVANGETLARVKSAELGEARSAYASAREESALARKNLERWNLGKKSEFEQVATSEEIAGWVDLDQAMADHDAAVAEQSLAEQMLARTKDLVSKELKTRSDLLLAEQEIARTKTRLDAAHRRLGVLGVVAKNDLARAQLKLQAAETRLVSLGVRPDERGPAAPPGTAETDGGVYEVRSRIGGIVLERHATLGESVEARDAMFVVADLGVVWIQTALYEKDLAKVREGLVATVRTPAFPDVIFPGRLVRVAHTVDEKTRTVVLQVEVQNAVPGGGEPKLPLRPGMFATVSIEIARESDVVVVPIESVQRVGTDFVVFVESEASAPPTGKAEAAPERRVAFEPRVVTLGTRDEVHVRVLKGLEPGEKVAIENAYLLKSELIKSQFAEEE